MLSFFYINHFRFQHERPEDMNNQIVMEGDEVFPSTLDQSILNFNLQDFLTANPDDFAEIQSNYISQN